MSHKTFEVIHIKNKLHRKIEKKCARRTEKLKKSVQGAPKNSKKVCKAHTILEKTVCTVFLRKMCTLGAIRGLVFMQKYEFYA
jgi:hypothetical protein